MLGCGERFRSAGRRERIGSRRARVRAAGGGDVAGDTGRAASSIGKIAGVRVALEPGAREWERRGAAWRGGALDAVENAGAGAVAGALAMTVQREEGARAPRTRFMITDILEAAPRDLSAHRDSDSDRSATDSPGRCAVLKIQINEKHKKMSLV